jgi:2-hydroxychromene-2-carboxylate isomerase
MPKKAHIECFFDYSSPWTYLAFSQIQNIVDRHPYATIEYKPILVGGIFNKTNPSVYEARKSTPVPAKAKYTNDDLMEWAEAFGLQIYGPYEKDSAKRVKPFPVNSVKSLRGAAFAAKEGKFMEYSYAVFHSYWGLRMDISQASVMRSIVSELGMDGDAFLEFISTDAAKQQIAANTDECMDRGGYGSPTFFVNTNHMYFGNDRLLLLERRILMEGGDTGANIGSGTFHGGGKSPLSHL